MADLHTPPGAPARLPIRTVTITGAALLATAYACIWLFAPFDLSQLGMFWPFGGLGLAGALVANSTGVGGGVVFVPAFSLLRESGAMDLSPAQAVGISFAIQCFGMSVGSLTWLNRFYRPEAAGGDALLRPLLWRILALVLATGLPALLVMQHVIAVDADIAFLLFKLFSIALGSALLLQLALSRYVGGDRTVLDRIDLVAILGIGIAGGSATAMFSVGTGELLALYLFLRRFPLDICVATAVIASAISVLTGLGLHLQAGYLVWEILIFAAPAVMLGGFLARRLAHWLGAFRLKLATGIWIISSSAILLLT